MVCCVWAPDVVVLPNSEPLPSVFCCWGCDVPKAPNKPPDAGWDVAGVEAVVAALLPTAPNRLFCGVWLPVAPIPENKFPDCGCDVAAAPRVPPKSPPADVDVVAVWGVPPL